MNRQKDYVLFTSHLRLLINTTEDERLADLLQRWLDAIEADPRGVMR